MKLVRWFFRVAAASSLALFLLVAGLWTSSYFITGWMPVFRGQKHGVYLGSTRGTLAIKHNSIDGPAEATFVRDSSAYTGIPEADGFVIRAGPNGQLGAMVTSSSLRLCWFVRVYPRTTLVATMLRADGTRVAVGCRMNQLAISYWLILLACSILPLMWYWNWRRRPLGPGFCRACGYDLRATPDRCPECGTAISASS